jgi:hypothetical protein
MSTSTLTGEIDLARGYSSGTVTIHAPTTNAAATALGRDWPFRIAIVT